MENMLLLVHHVNTRQHHSTDSTSSSFCVNGGKCQEDNTCKCDSPWIGVHCEYPISLSDVLNKHGDDTDDATPTNSAAECNLDCQNGGVCAHGAKELGSLYEVFGDVSHLNVTHAENEFAHCICKQGWIGIKCEQKVEVCGKDQHVCLHGSKCIPDSSNDRGYHCDCSVADDTVEGEKHFFAGDFCEYIDTDMCTVGEDPQEPLYFCVNGGECNALVGEGIPDPGCACPSNFTGPHCEVNMAVTKSYRASSRKDHSMLITIIISTVLAAAAIFGLGIFGMIQRRKADASETADGVFSGNIAPTSTRASRGRRRIQFVGKSGPNTPNSDGDDDSDINPEGSEIILADENTTNPRDNDRDAVDNHLRYTDEYDVENDPYHDQYTLS